MSWIRDCQNFKPEDIMDYEFVDVMYQAISMDLQKRQLVDPNAKRVYELFGEGVSKEDDFIGHVTNRLKDFGLKRVDSIRNTVYFFDEDTLVISTSRENRPKYLKCITSNHAIHEALKDIAESLKGSVEDNREERGPFYSLTKSPNGQFQLIKIADVGLPLRESNYKRSVVNQIQRAKQDLASDYPRGRIVIIHGPPRTGKTHLIRYLSTTPNCYFVRISIADVLKLDDGDLMLALSEIRDEGECRVVFVIEDADHLLAQRQADNAHLIAPLLNGSDGIFSDATDVRFILTSNREWKDIDDAIKGDGRLSEQILVPELDSNEATLALQSIFGFGSLLPAQIPFKGNRSYSLGSVYKAARELGWDPPQRKRTVDAGRAVSVMRKTQARKRLEIGQLVDQLPDYQKKCCTAGATRVTPVLMQTEFFLGTHHPEWLASSKVSLFVSDVTLRKMKSLPRAVCDSAIDSGGFSELSMHGTWTVSPQDYVARVRRYVEEIGRIRWAAIQDWMCEPDIIKKTGLSVEEHQRRTVDSLVTLRSLAPELPWVPVLQGWACGDHERHLEMYFERGFDLRDEPIVGIGSVCRRQDTLRVSTTISVLSKVCGLKLHGFGFKTKGLEGLSGVLASADSLAWSLAARYEAPLPGHDRPGPGRVRGHKTCSNCYEFAEQWREDLFSRNKMLC